LFRWGRIPESQKIQWSPSLFLATIYFARKLISLRRAFRKVRTLSCEAYGKKTSFCGRVGRFFFSQTLPPKSSEKLDINFQKKNHVPGDSFVPFFIPYLEVYLTFTQSSQKGHKELPGTPPKINMEPQNGDLEDDFPLQWGDF